MQQACIRGGELSHTITNITPRNFIIWPNLDLVPKVSAAYEKMIGEDEKLRFNMEKAHRNFLKTAVYLLYEDGRTDQAAYWFNYMKSKYADALVGRQKNLSLDDYCLSQIVEDNGETDMNKISASIEAMFHNGFICLVRDDQDRYANYENLAQRIWEHYTTKIGSFGKERLGLRPLPELRNFVLQQELDPDPRYARMPPEAQAILRTKLRLPTPKPATAPVPAPGPTASTAQ
jgi:hypothetical protein